MTVEALQMLGVQLTCFPRTIGDNLEGMKVGFSQKLWWSYEKVYSSVSLLPWVFIIKTLKIYYLELILQIENSLFWMYMCTLAKIFLSFARIWLCRIEVGKSQDLRSYVDWHLFLVLPHTLAFLRLYRADGFVSLLSLT